MQLQAHGLCKRQCKWKVWKDHFPTAQTMLLWKDGPPVNAMYAKIDFSNFPKKKMQKIWKPLKGSIKDQQLTRLHFHHSRIRSHCWPRICKGMHVIATWVPTPEGAQPSHSSSLVTTGPLATSVGGRAVVAARSESVVPSSAAVSTITESSVSLM